jgi:hypothetical protein
MRFAPIRVRREISVSRLRFSRRSLLLGSSTSHGYHTQQFTGMTQRICKTLGKVLKLFTYQLAGTPRCQMKYLSQHLIFDLA